MKYEVQFPTEGDVLVVTHMDNESSARAFVRNMFGKTTTIRVNGEPTDKFKWADRIMQGETQVACIVAR